MQYVNAICDMYFTVFTEKIKVFYVIVLRVSLHAGSQSQPTVAGLTELEAVNAIIFQKPYLPSCLLASFGQKTSVHS